MCKTIERIRTANTLEMNSPDNKEINENMERKKKVCKGDGIFFHATIKPLGPSFIRTGKWSKSIKDEKMTTKIRSTRLVPPMLKE